MLVFMLGVILPAAALIGVGVWHLTTIQRDKAIEAVFQREFQQVLAIAEKRIDARAYDIAEEASAKFPEANQGDKLEDFLTAHPDIASAFLWTGKGHLEIQSQPDRMGDPETGKDEKELSSMLGAWFDLESKDLIAKLKKIQAVEGRHVYFTNNWVTRGDKMQYQSLAVFMPRGSTGEHPALAGFVYDTDYLSNKFFPQALNDVLPNQNNNDTSHPQPVIMVRTGKDRAPLAASTCWDGGPPEVERSLEGVFPGLILGIKLRGTTIANISNHFVRTAFLILGALSLLMGGGVLLAYRNVARELGLAKLKSDFVSNVSHELRTPLALIRLYAETLELGRIANPGKRQEYYEIIRKESQTSLEGHFHEDIGPAVRHRRKSLRIHMPESDRFVQVDCICKLAVAAEEKRSCADDPGLGNNVVKQATPQTSAAQARRNRHFGKFVDSVAHGDKRNAPYGFVAGIRHEDMAPLEED